MYADKSRQSCPTLCDPIDSSPPGSPIPGILQAGTQEWVAISFSNAWKWKVKVKSLSRIRLLATPWTAAYQVLRPWDFPGKSTGVGLYSTNVVAEVQKSRGDGGRGNSCSQKKWTLYAGHLLKKVFSTSCGRGVHSSYLLMNQLKIPCGEFKICSRLHVRQDSNTVCLIPLSLIFLFLFFFWPHGVACGIKPMPPALGLRSLNH